MGLTTRRRQNFYRQFSLALVWAASSLTLATAVANTEMGHALRIASGGAVSLGQVALVLLWVTWTLSLVFAANLTMKLRSKSGAGLKAGVGGNSILGAFANQMGVVVL